MTLPGDSDESTPLLRNPRVHNDASWRWNPQYTVAVLGCMGLLVEYCQRVNLSVAIVVMAGTAAENTSYACPGHNDSLLPVHKGEFEWDKQTEGVVLGAFFWGYATTNIIGGRISEYLGGKKIFGMGIITSSFLSLISPLCARASVGLFIACRILLGVVQGVTFPAVNTMLATWVVPAERSKFSTIVFSGFQLGTVVGMTSSGWLASSHFLEGWPSTFYVFGVAGLVWGLVWCAIVYDRPEDHPKISIAYLRILRQHQDSLKRAEIVAVPWRAIVTSLPFWALVAASLGTDFSFYTLLTEMPSYLNDVHHFDLISNGLVSALPYLLMWAWSMLWALMMDALTHVNWLSILTVRRLSMATAMYGPMLGLVAMVFAVCQAMIAALVLLCVSCMLMGAVNSGLMCSHQDLAPNLAGTLLGITNTIGALAGIASPAITGYILHHDATLWGWRLVFIIIGGLYLLTCSLYLIMISADLQPWNDPKIQELCEGEDVAEYGPVTAHHMPADQAH